MKKRTLYNCICTWLSVFIVCNMVSAQDGKPDMQTLLQTKNYLFTALFAQPLSGNQVTLTSTYTLRIAGDSLVCQLPYFGRAYAVENYPAGGGGLQFMSHHFDYVITPGKHSRYMVMIKINDITTIQQMYLHVSKNGYANLLITPVNRQTISYYGKVAALPARKQESGKK